MSGTSPPEGASVFDVEAGKKIALTQPAIDDTPVPTTVQRCAQNCGAAVNLQHEIRIAIVDHHQLVLADELTNRLGAISLDAFFIALCRNLANEIGVSVPEAAAAIYPVARSMHQAALAVRRAL